MPLYLYLLIHVLWYLFTFSCGKSLMCLCLFVCICVCACVCVWLHRQVHRVHLYFTGTTATTCSRTLGLAPSAEPARLNSPDFIINVCTLRIAAHPDRPGQVGVWNHSSSSPLFSKEEPYLQHSWSSSYFAAGRSVDAFIQTATQTLIYSGRGHGVHGEVETLNQEKERERS